MNAPKPSIDERVEESFRSSVGSCRPSLLVASGSTPLCSLFYAAFLILPAKTIDIESLPTYLLLLYPLHPKIVNIFSNVHKKVLTILLFCPKISYVRLIRGAA